jgi:hypothetical protein
VSFIDFDSARDSEPFYINVGVNSVKWVVVKYDNDTTETFKLDASSVTLYQAPAAVSLMDIDTDLYDEELYTLNETTADGDTFRTLEVSITNLHSYELNDTEGYWVSVTISAGRQNDCGILCFNITA